MLDTQPAQTLLQSLDEHTDTWVNMAILPEMEPLAEGSFGYVNYFPAGPPEGPPWSTCVVSKRLPLMFRNNYQAERCLKEAILTKLFADCKIGTPCNLTPRCPRSEHHIFVAHQVMTYEGQTTDIESIEYIHIFLNRMSGTFLEGMEKEGESNTWQVSPVQTHIQDTLSSQMQRMIDAGFVCVDIKPDNILYLSRNERERQNEISRGLYEKEAYETLEDNITPFPLVFLSDFDPDYCCSVRSQNMYVAEDTDMYAVDVEPTFIFHNKTDAIELCMQDLSPQQKTAYLVFSKSMIGAIIPFLFQSETEKVVGFMDHLGKGESLDDFLWQAFGPFSKRISQYSEVYNTKSVFKEGESPRNLRVTYSKAINSYRNKRKRQEGEASSLGFL
tara:strand:- start:193 stop:1353 length:1161 start_codon:yes stop_codon:yes gene_type:complete